MAQMDRMQLGDHVILDFGKNKQALLKLKSDGTVMVNRNYCSTSPLEGEPYGSLFEVSPNSTTLEKRLRICETAAEDWTQVTDIDRNNSALQDAGPANQTLTAKDIAKLKAEGKSGDEIVAALTQNSATFRGKTQYSQVKWELEKVGFESSPLSLHKPKGVQASVHYVASRKEKYMKRKKKKYSCIVSTVKPTACTLAEFYFSKNPMKTSQLRSDTLALLLSFANIGAGSRVLIAEHAGGLITGAVLERLGGFGSVVDTFPGQKAPPSSIVNAFNLPESSKQIRDSCDITSLLALLRGQEEPLPTEPSQHKRQRVEPEKQPQAQQQPQAASAKSAARIEGNSATAGETLQPPDSTAISKNDTGPATALAAQNEGHNSVTEGAEAMDTEGGTQDEEREGLSQSMTGVEVAETQPLSEGEEAALRHTLWLDRQESKRSRLRALCQQGFQSCILAAPSIAPAELLEAVMPLLAPSASFAVYFPALQPLADCMMHMQLYFIEQYVDERVIALSTLTCSSLSSSYRPDIGASQKV